MLLTVFKENSRNIISTKMMKPKDEIEEIQRGQPWTLRIN